MNFLRDLSIEEISLVDKGASRKRFTVIKRDEETLQDQLTEIFDEDSEEDISAFIISKADQLTEEEMEAFRDAVKQVSEYAGDMPSDLLDSIREILVHFKTNEKEPEKFQDEKISEADEERDARLAKGKDQYPSIPIPYIEQKEEVELTSEEIVKKCSENNDYPSVPSMVKARTGIVMVVKSDEDEKEIEEEIEEEEEDEE